MIESSNKYEYSLYAFYKSIYKAIDIVNDTIIYPIKWYENGKAIEIIVARKED